MVGGLLKRISKLKDIKASNPSKKQLEDFYKKWQKENKVSSGVLSEEGKKKQVKKFVDIRKRTKSTRQKKKFD